MGEFIKVAEVDDLAEGELLGVEAHGEPICLAKVDGVVYAFTDNCTHVSGPLNEGELEDEVLTCPWHAAQFDVRSGKVLRGPARQDIATYAVRMEEEAIWVDVPDVPDEE